MPNKTYKQILESENKYSKLGCPQTMLSSEDEETVKSYIEAHPNDPDVRRLNNMLDTNDYSEFEKLPFGLINYQATLEVHKFLNVSQNMNPEDEAVKTMMRENLRNPFFRTALDLCANTLEIDKTIRDNCRTISTAMTEMIMENTLSPLDFESVKNLSDSGKSKDEIALLAENDAKTQMTIAKTMFLSHLGSLHIMQKNSRSSEYTGSLSDLFARGARTIYCFKKGDPDEDTIENMVFRDRYDDNGDIVDNGTGVESRTFASHGVSVNGDLDGPEAFTEKSSILNPTYWSSNYCANPAVGGLGKKYGAKTITADGKNGHMYIKKVESTEDTNGYLMVGFESEAPGEVGASGHKHSWRATPSKISAFGLTKGAPGSKLGGRMADLSAYDHDVLSYLLLAFNQKYRSLKKIVNDHVCRNMENASGEEPENIRDARNKIANINKKLCGPMMTPDELVSFMKNDLGIEKIKTVNDWGVTTEMPVESVAETKKREGAANFKRMNARLDKNRNIEESELDKEMKKISYSVEKGFDRYVKALDKAKRKTLGITRSDSGKMKRIKEALAKMADISVNTNALDARRACDELKAAADDYLTDPKKARNDRYEIVKRIRNLLEADIKGVEKESENAKNAVKEKNAESRNAKALDDIKNANISITSSIAAENFKQLREAGASAMNRLLEKCKSMGTERFKCGDDLRDIVSFNIVKSALSGANPDKDIVTLLQKPDFMSSYREYFSCDALNRYANELHSPKIVGRILRNETGLNKSNNKMEKMLDHIINHTKSEVQRKHNSVQNAVSSPDNNVIEESKSTEYTINK